MYEGTYIYNICSKCRLLVSRMLRWPWNLMQDAAHLAKADLARWMSPERGGARAVFQPLLRSVTLDESPCLGYRVPQPPQLPPHAIHTSFKTGGV